MLKSLIDLLFPPLCHCCKAHIPHAGRIHVCDDCLRTTGVIGSPVCPACGVPFATEGGVDHPCGRCIAHPPPFDSASAPFLYEGAIRDLVHRLKYDRTVQCRRPLGLLLAERMAGLVPSFGPDLIVPVPLHVKRLRSRGFNQAILLGELLAKEWCVPLKRQVLQRIRWTEPQVNLAAAERSANVRGAFAVADPQCVSGKRLILVDDVLTTGSTVAECSRVLKKSGAAAVHVLTIARVPAEPH